jgi:hypothetical protein
MSLPVSLSFLLIRAQTLPKPTGGGNVYSLIETSSGSGATFKECDPALPCADNSNKCIFWAQAGKCAKVGAALPAAACRAR